MKLENFKNYYLGKNTLFFPEYEFVIKLSFPRVFVKYKTSEGYYSNFEKFFKNVAEVQYLEGDRPSDFDHQHILNNIWNYITMEKGLINDDFIEGNNNS